MPDETESKPFEWRRVNGALFEYAIRQGPHGDEFVKDADGQLLQRPVAGPLLPQRTED